MVLVNSLTLRIFGIDLSKGLFSVLLTRVGYLAHETFLFSGRSWKWMEIAGWWRLHWLAGGFQYMKVILKFA
ncbi:hypothetical protein D3Z38_13930 [Clostridiales bacterium]|nr:hypothetical protein [Clostridiales bacterium]